MSKQATPEYLVPRLGELPVSSSRHYQTATITGLISGPAGVTTAIEQPMSVPTPADVRAGQPAVGVLLTHQQQWILAGTALGPLLHSVCLAPGEVTQIAVNSHTRRVMQNSVDRGIQRDDASSMSDSASALQESQRTGVTNAQGGMSLAASASSTTQIGAGGLAGFIGVSMGGSSTLAGSSQASFSTGDRSVSDQANQSVHQAARDQASSTRAAASVAVREVSESDSVEINTRVIANYNHMHALTMEYFEVEQVYQLRTTVTDAERLLFVPMQVIDFSVSTQASAAISRYRSELIAVAAELGLSAVVAGLVAGRLRASDPDPVASGTGPSEADPFEAAVKRFATEQETAQKDVTTAQGELENADDAVAHARDTLRAARDGTLLARSTAQRSLQQAMAQTRTAQDTLQQKQYALAAASEAARTAGWELEQRRLAASMTEKGLHDALDEHRLAVNQGLWLRLDPSMAAGFLQRRVHGDDPLGDVVDPTPVAVSGHLLGFRWRFRDPAQEAVFVGQHTGQSTLEHSVSVPTGGLFGEAVLGTSNGAERIDLTRFWNWKDALPPIRPAQIAPQQVGPAKKLDAATDTGAQAAQLDLGPISFPDVAPTLPAVAGLLGNPDLFRDMSSRATTAALAQSAMQLSAQGASTAASLAAANYQRFLSFQHTVASAVLDAVKRKQPDPTLSGGALNARESAATEEPAGPTDAQEPEGTGASAAGGEPSIPSTAAGGSASSGSGAARREGPGTGTGTTAGTAAPEQEAPSGNTTLTVDFEARETP